ncbi:MAG TPA: PAS domain S-box protein [Opitutaceae bacterium]|nr:PAS domain S-box protein [Opitutaceae bacterium]
MKRLGWILLLLSSAAAFAAPPRIRIGVESNSEPLSFIDAEGRPTGFSSELIQVMGRDGTFQPEIVSGSWSYILQEFKNGNLDALANVTVTEDRKDTMRFSISHAYLHAIAYFRRDRAPLRHSSDLAGKTIGALKGSVAYFMPLSHPEWRVTIKGFSSMQEALAATDRGEIDGAMFMLALPKGTNDFGLRNEFIEDIVFRFHFAVPRGGDETLAILNESLAEVRHNGEFDRIWRKWLGPIEPHPILLADLKPFMLPLALVLAAVGALFWWQRHMLARVSAQARALEESEQRFRSTFDNAGTGMALVRLDGRVMRANPNFQRMLGYTEAELEQRTMAELTFREDLDRDASLYSDLMAGRRDSYQIEKRYTRKDSRLVWGHLTVSIVKSAHDTPLYAVEMVDDITDLKRTQDALKVTQERLQAILDYSPALIYVKNLEGRFLLTNRLFNEKYQHSGASIIGMTIRDLVAPDQADQREKHDRLVIEKGAPVTTEEHGEENGVKKTYLAVKFPLRDAQGHIYALGGVDTDITEYAQLQTQFVQAQKMDAFGQLAGGIAHDFNNILAVLMIQLNLLASDRALAPAVVTKLRGLEAITQKAARLTRQLLMFSRREATAMQVMDLNQCLVDIFKMLGRVLGEHIEMTLRNRTTQMWINADAGMMEQVVMNLCVNARDAMPDGGRLLVDTEYAAFTPETARQRDGRKAGRFVCLTVADSGHGMDPATLKRIFEPFFTTKEVGKGTGLGLATVYGIVKQHGGWVEVDSTVGQGSTFRVYLPAVESPVPEAANEAAPDVPGGKERILIVEDDPAVREVAAMCLEEVGYSVVVTPDAVKGLQIWEEHGQRFDLLLTDMVMPGGMSGLRLAKMLKEMKPALKVIIVSGYSAEASDSKTPFTEVGVYVSKPIDRITLLTVVRKTLDS